MRALTAILILAAGATGLGLGEPLSADALMRRGIEHFRAGKIPEAVADFEHVARIEPSRKAELWQLGIAYYYANEFAKGRDLFALHQTVNPEDVENAVWHFLCVSRMDGIEQARRQLIPIRRDPRIPMKEIHALFAGSGTADQVFKAARESPRDRANSLFYAHLYVSLHEEARGNHSESLAHMRKAVQEFGQVHYMGAVARVHLLLREKARGEGKKN